MASDAEVDAIEKIMKKYGAQLRAAGLTTKTTTSGERPKLQNKKAVIEIVGKKMYDDYLTARGDRKAGRAPPGIDSEIKKLDRADNKIRRLQKDKDMTRETEITTQLISKYPQLQEYKRGNRLMIQAGKAKEIRGILKGADLKLYDDMIEARKSRKAGKPMAAGGAPKKRKKAEPVKNRKTVPQQMARKELIEGKVAAPSGQAKRPYLKRNIRKGAKGAVMTGDN